jgi:predicted lipoprotein with Yx(FWY)xxD motif
MTRILETRPHRLGLTLLAIGAAVFTVAAAQAATSSRSHRQSAGVLLAIRKTALGSILVDARGRTLYLFEKDNNGVSMCSGPCAAYWPPLTSHGALRIGGGVHRTLVTLGKAHNGARQVIYAGHPLYTFVGDKHAGQTTGEGLTNFGAGWYAVAASGQKVDKSDGTSSDSSGSAGGYDSGSGW